MPFVNHQLFPSAPDPVVPSVMVEGLLDDDGRNNVTFVSVVRAAFFTLGMFLWAAW